MMKKEIVSDVIDIVLETKKESIKNPKQFVKLNDNTIKPLVEYGVPDFAMLERVGHVRENILTEEQAKKLGYSIKNKHFHGLGVRNYLDIIDSMDNPVAIYQYEKGGKYNKDNFIIITPFKCNDENFIIPIEINRNGQYERKNIKYNRIKTVYAKPNTKLKKLFDNGQIKEIFTGSNYQQISLDRNNISQYVNSVNNTYCVNDEEKFESRIEETYTLHYNNNLLEKNVLISTLMC